MLEPKIQVLKLIWVSMSDQGAAYEKEEMGYNINLIWILKCNLWGKTDLEVI